MAGYPYDAFHIDLPHSSLRGNAHVVINKHGRLRKKDVNYYIVDDETSQKNEDVDMIGEKKSEFEWMFMT